jgi:glycosyltransferase involved in cell wall biosynthesis
VTTLPILSINPPDGRQPLVFAWGVSSFFGWGLYGLNLAISLANHPIFSPVAAMAFGPGDLVLDPLRENLIQAVGALSADLWASLAALPQPEAHINAPLLMGLGKDLHAVTAAGDKFLTGQPSIGVTFIEHSTLSDVGRRRADQFALIIAGSTWNESVLRANGIVATTTVLQGVDTSLFHPAPCTGRFRDRFVVFSGGKLEYRKGQDLVVKAFRIFQQRHPEALLLTAWTTPWHWHDPFMAAGTNTVPASPDAEGWVDTAGWAIANGVPAQALIALGKVPNIAMPHVMREADVALFPNRCEGGTNLVAMECMACGIPTILSANTGHLDLLVRNDVAYRLDRQGPAACEGYDTRDWGESDVEEILENLETVWRDRQAATAVGQRGSAFIAPMTWERQTALLLRAIEPLLP